MQCDIAGADCKADAIKVVDEYVKGVKKTEAAAVVVNMLSQLGVTSRCFPEYVHIPGSQIDNLEYTGFSMLRVRCSFCGFQIPLVGSRCPPVTSWQT